MRTRSTQTPPFHAHLLRRAGPRIAEALARDQRGIICVDASGEHAEPPRAVRAYAREALRNNKTHLVLAVQDQNSYHCTIISAAPTRRPRN